MNPLPVDVLALVTIEPASKALHYERLLHAQFACFRHRHEWFVADPQLVEHALELASESVDEPR